MKVLYYTTGASGSGHQVIGISIANALRRRGGDHSFTILTNSGTFADLFETMGVAHQEVPAEDEMQLSPESYPSSALYRAVVELNPDVLVVTMHWFMLASFIRELPCRKVFLCRQVDERFFTIPMGAKTLAFQARDYDLALSIEPFATDQPFQRIDPIVIRNRNEILPRAAALQKLGLRESGTHCLFAFNGKPREFKEVKKMYSYLEDEGCQMVYSTNYRGGLFPAVDYFNAFEMVICGAGYNAFWEAVYFGKEAIFVPQQRRFENQSWRVEECQDYEFTRNGADELVELILGL